MSQNKHGVYGTHVELSKLTNVLKISDANIINYDRNVIFYDVVIKKYIKYFFHLKKKK